MIFWKVLKNFYQKAAEKMCQETKDFIREEEKILDLGCGSGVLAKEIERTFKAKIFAIDVKDNRVYQVPFKVYDGRNIPFPKDFFDTVLICFVLHHCQNPVELLKEAKRVGKKIIIFEDLAEGILGKLRCFAHWLSWNLFFAKSFSRFNFQTEKRWEEIFENLGLELTAKKDFLPGFKFLDPVKRKIFILKRKREGV